MIFTMDRQNQGGGTRDLWRHRTSLYQHCGRGHIAACIELDDTIFAGSASIQEVSMIWLVLGSYFFTVVLVANVLYFLLSGKHR